MPSSFLFDVLLTPSFNVAAVHARGWYFTKRIPLELLTDHSLSPLRPVYLFREHPLSIQSHRLKLKKGNYKGMICRKLHSSPRINKMDFISAYRMILTDSQHN